MVTRSFFARSRNVAHHYPGCGGAQQQAPRGEAPVLRWLSGAVFCLYSLHQTVIVLLTRLLLPLNLPWGVKALLLNQGLASEV